MPEEVMGSGMSGERGKKGRRREGKLWERTRERNKTMTPYVASFFFFFFFSLF